MSLKNTGSPNGDNRRAGLYLKKAKESDYVRAREPVRPTSGRVSGYYPSIKNGRSVAWESQLEKRACNVFEFSRIVEAYYEQPTLIEFISEGELRKSTPDFKLSLKTGLTVFVEVKPFDKLDTPLERQKFIDLSNHLKDLGYLFIVLTDRELNHMTRQSNLSLLRPYLSQTIEQDKIEFVEHLYQRESQITIEQLSISLGSLTDAYTLLANRIIAANLDEHISLESETYFNKENTNENSIFTFRTAPQFKCHTFHYQTNS